MDMMLTSGLYDYLAWQLLSSSMSNELVSQHLPVSGNQMGQFEPISSNLDQQLQMGFMSFETSESLCQQMPLSDIQMGQVESVFGHSPAEQMSISESQNVFFDPLLSQHGLELLPTSNQASGQGKHDPYGHSLQQQAALSKPVGGMGMISHGVRPPQEMSILNKRKAHMESMSNNPTLEKFSLPNKRMAQMEHRPWLQQSSSFSKRTVQIQSPPTAPVSPSLPTPNRKASSNKSVTSVSKTQSLQMQPSPKGKSESFESVRSKMRESLTAALALVHEEKSKASDSGKSSQIETASDHGKIQQDVCPTESVSACHVAVGSSVSDHQEMCSSTQDDLANGKANSVLQVSKCGGQEYKLTNILPAADVPFSDNIFASDELLHGNGLSWVLDPGAVAKEKKNFQAPAKLKLENEAASQVVKEHPDESPDFLAFKIEEELFKLFGGVNKKYKEKGRSLLFNLKDRNNPELRERVMSGDIPPDRLCSMSAEDLASKELSEWRQAKAEELAQMVVLPDTEVDIRRLVKKTHKGEFHVEVEQSDNSVEVSAGVTLHNSQPRNEVKPETEIRPKTVTKRKTGIRQVQAASKAEAVNNETDAIGARNKTENQSDSCTITIPSNEGGYLMQGFDDEMKDTEFLPPIVSLDEFMQSLDSEPPFVNLPSDAGAATPTSDKDAPEVGSESKSPVRTLEESVDAAPEKPENVDLSNTDSGEAKSDNIPVKTESTQSASTLKGELVWEGSVQLSITTAMPMIAIFKSGEKTPTKGWLNTVEIKGRVRLDAFDKFLQELPMSRSRAVMVLHFVSKEGTPTSLAEVADSYIADGRVGFGEPGSGVELYFCPPHSKTLEMLAKILPKDQLDSLNAIDNGLIGVVVWRRAQVISPNSSSHHKQHTSKRQHLSSRKQDSTLNANFSPKPSLPQSKGGPPPSTFPKPSPPKHVDDGDDDDVPPGFGPGAASRDEDDLPEFNFSGGSKLPRPSRYPPQGPAVAPPRPVDEVRQLIQKYGQPQSQPNPRSAPAMQPWNDDDDDIPEWQPQAAQQHVPASHRFSLPQQQPLPPAMHVQGLPNTAQPWQQQGQYWTTPPQGGNQFYGSSTRSGQQGWR